ncbi:peptidoglycan-binding protein [Nocardiopsis sediminis]|uniref:Peptidoglycan-binding protein n=1 Tax=Nocardiopsis sediminis TaxID=1778267 RepID=A0ABV8FSH4_9ACTN
MNYRSWTTALLAGAALLSAGAGAGYLLRPADVPSGLAASDGQTTAPVTREEFADERTAQVAFQVTPESTLEIGLSGRVTTTDCAAGAELVSGEAVATIGATPLIALATEVPLYRDLEEGDRGGDVQALQRELARLGYAVGDDGVFGRPTATAVRDLLESAGVRDPDGEIESDQVLWLPSPTSVLDECEAPLGMTVGGGAPFGTVPGGLDGIRVDAMPGGAVEGDRIIDVFGIRGPMSEEGEVTDQGFLDEVEAAPEFAEFLSSEEAVTAEISLAEPLQALKVPPGAVFGIDGDDACIESGGTAHPVRIVGSNLGATLVVLDGEAPADVNLGSAIRSESCD